MRVGQECIDYLNSTVWATLGVSPIHRVGVFAIRDIPSGTEITDNIVGLSNGNSVDVRKYVKNSLTEEEFKEVSPEIRKLILDRTLFDKEMPQIEFYSPNSDVILQSFMNHSGTPNTDGKKTLRNIDKNEELTENFRSLIANDFHPLSKGHMKHFIGGRRKNKTRRR
jgi:hypothetical protein